MQQRGFSLVQLMVAVTVAAVLMHLALPHYQAMTQAQRRQIAAHELLTGLRVARTEAVLRNQDVVIHALDGDWSSGWRIIADHSGQGASDERNPVLRVNQGDPRLAVYGNSPVRAQVRFTAQGWALQDSGAFQAGTVHVCDGHTGESHYQVVIAKSGRVHLTNERAAQALCSIQQSDRLDA
ncbi:GspH/FimT family pseudopilin [Pseudomonas sp.]|uniref:GspH/FimT family pseudopilin n=1 Tax=Pseudomonas sp. TaxID=306 RepID=UPI003CC69126